MSKGSIDLKFTYERETKNKVRFIEQVDGDADPVIGKLYVGKGWLEDKGSPKDLRVSIEAYK